MAISAIGSCRCELVHRQEWAISPTRIGTASACVQRKVKKIRLWYKSHSFFVFILVLILLFLFVRILLQDLVPIPASVIQPHTHKVELYHWSNIDIDIVALATMRISLLVISMAALAIAAPLTRPACTASPICFYECHMERMSSWSILDFQSDTLLAVGTESTSSYATSTKPGNKFEADTFLAVGAPDESSYAT